MDFHSFQYPPRPIPSDTHKPSRYYFHNLDQDTVLIRKNKPTVFQKEGVAPALTSSLSAMTLDASTSFPSSFTQGTQPPQQQLLQEEPSSPVQNFAAPAPPPPVSINIAALEILDRTKFIAN